MSLGVVLKACFDSGALPTPDQSTLSVRDYSDINVDVHLDPHLSGCCTDHSFLEQLWTSGLYYPL